MTDNNEGIPPGLAGFYRQQRATPSPQPSPATAAESPAAHYIHELLSALQNRYPGVQDATWNALRTELLTALPTHGKHNAADPVAAVHRETSLCVIADAIITQADAAANLTHAPQTHPRIGQTIARGAQRDVTGRIIALAAGLQSIPTIDQLNAENAQQLALLQQRWCGTHLPSRGRSR